MEEVTNASEVIDFFESTFADKEVIPFDLEIVWLKRAVSRYSLELDPLNFNDAFSHFDSKIDNTIISTLAAFMKEFYQERQVSKVNKRISIVGKDISIDGSNGTKSAENEHLKYVAEKSRDMIENQKPTAFI